MTDNNTLFDLGTSYDNVETEEVLINGNSEVVEAQDVTPFDVIRKLAEGLGQTIKDPKPNCKDCYGRGYTGRDASTKAPIPCHCIYDDFTSAQNTAMYEKTRPISRKERRAMQRNMKKQIKKMRKGLV